MSERMVLVLAWAVVFLVPMVAGCYSPRFDPCAVSCGAGGLCPTGTTCGTDGYCRGSGDTTSCVEMIDGGADAPATDGPPPDGSESGPAFVAISAGANHTCGIDDSGATAGAGRLWCWGSNELGALGIAPTTVRRAGAPRLVDVNDDWVRVSAGGAHTCGIRGTALYCWGSNSHFQIGDPTMTLDALIPSPNPVLTGTAFREVSAGPAATCAIDTADTLWCWGDNNFAMLGRDTIGGVSAMPAEVMTGDAPTNAFQAVDVGYQHVCAIHTSDELYCWGGGGNGRLGNGVSGGIEMTPALVDSPEDAWGTIAAGRDQSCATTTDGKLYCWGNNSSGQAGLPTSDDRLRPERVGADSDWTAVRTSFYHTCGTRGSAVNCTGANDWGQLGVGDWRGASLGFLPVTGGVDAVALTVGDLHVCALDASGSLWCWGGNNSGQLGEGAPTDEWTPARVTPATWKRVAAGARHSCAIDSGDRLFCWGLNDADQLGSDDLVVGDTRATPLQVGVAEDWSEVVVGDFHTCGRRGGALWCWGANGDNQTGIATGTTHLPTPIGARSDWTALGTRRSSVCGVAGTGGERLCWGLSDLHQLGRDSTAKVTTPTAVADTIMWSAVSIGQRFGCGIATDAQLYCWGDREHGAVGDGMTSLTPASTPQAIGTGYAQVAASIGRGHACGIAGGALRCWGYNNVGQLGLGDGSDRDQPTPVGAATTWTAVTVGAEHTCGLDGQSLHCWGFNPNGRLGDGTTINRDTPGASVTPGMMWKSISAGEYHTCGIAQDDGLYCWGDGTYGQLGLGRSARTAPLQITLPN